MPPDTLAASVEECFRRAQTENDRADAATETELEAARASGDWLRAAKQKVIDGGGQWLPALKDHTTLKTRTAQRNMELSEYWTAVVAYASRVSHPIPTSWLAFKRELRALRAEHTGATQAAATPRKSTLVHLREAWARATAEERDAFRAEIVDTTETDAAMVVEPTAGPTSADAPVDGLGRRTIGKVLSAAKLLGFLPPAPEAA
jgi:hypothetical protein